MKTRLLIALLSIAVLFNCEDKKKTEPIDEVSNEFSKPFVWEGLIFISC